MGSGLKTRFIKPSCQYRDSRTVAVKIHSGNVEARARRWRSNPCGSVAPRVGEGERGGWGRREARPYLPGKSVNVEGE